MNYNKFKVGDLVRWNPNEYDILAGDKSDTGVVIEIGDSAGSIRKPLRRYVLIKWVNAGTMRIVHGNASWEKAKVLARTK
jgi:hypothetical protein